MKCPTCGVEVVQEAGFCHKCGARLGGAADEGPSGGVARLRDAASRRDLPDTPEETVWVGTFSYKAMIGAWLLAGLITLAAIAAGVLAAATVVAPVVIGVAVLLLWCYLFGLLIYRRMSVRYRLTNHQLFHERGILKRVTDRIEVIDMDDITVEQGIVERMVGVGTIRISSSDRTDPELLLPGIDDASGIARRVDELRRAERMRRGLHIESI